MGTDKIFSNTHILSFRFFFGGGVAVTCKLKSQQKPNIVGNHKRKWVREFKNKIIIGFWRTINSSTENSWMS